MAKNLAVQLIDSTLVVVHNAVAPDDDDWQVFMDAWKQHLDKVKAQLVYSDGGAPNSEQRRTSVAMISSRRAGPPPTAVLTDSMLGRGAVTALGWFIRERIRAFSPERMSEACKFLGVSHQESQLRQSVRELRRQLSLRALQGGGRDG
jgi:hypothetical protein